jgi:hypothetical protein
MSPRLESDRHYHPRYCVDQPKVGALAGFGLDSLIEIGASAVAIWELSSTGHARQRFPLRLIGLAFAAHLLGRLLNSLAGWWRADNTRVESSDSPRTR